MSLKKLWIRSLRRCDLKHVFIVNPAAGLINRSHEAVHNIERVFSARGLEHYTFITEYPKHGYELTKKMCEFFNGETIRFYACGGMGTLNEIINAVPSFEDVQFALYPIGFENNFARLMGRKERDFLNIEALLNGEVKKFDLLKINDLYVINAICIGNDAKVSADMKSGKLKKLGLLNRSLPYLLPILKNIIFIRVLDTTYIIDVDGKNHSGRYAMLAFMNNNTYGTMFYPRPDAVPDDGVISSLFVATDSHLQTILNMSKMQEGKLVNDMKLTSAVNGKQFKVRQRNNMPMIIDADGQIIKSNNVFIEVVPHAVDFILPRIWSDQL